jgi:hypothetical protein
MRRLRAEVILRASARPAALQGATVQTSSRCVPPGPERVWLAPRVPRSGDDRLNACGNRSRYATAAGPPVRPGSFAAGELIRARPARPGELHLKWCRRCAAAAFLDAGLVALVGLACWSGRGGRARLRLRRDIRRRRPWPSRKPTHFQRLTSTASGNNNATAAEQVLDACQPERRHWERHTGRLCHSELLSPRPLGTFGGGEQP